MLDIGPKSKREIRCLPYGYFLGTSKCGTSDLMNTIEKHPNITLGSSGDYSWWNLKLVGRWQHEIQKRSGERERERAEEKRWKDKGKERGRQKEREGIALKQMMFMLTRSYSDDADKLCEPRTYCCQ